MIVFSGNITGAITRSIVIPAVDAGLITLKIPAVIEDELTEVHHVATSRQDLPPTK